jgi:hypothetical protein
MVKKRQVLHNVGKFLTGESLSAYEEKLHSVESAMDLGYGP